MIGVNMGATITASEDIKVNDAATPDEDARPRAYPSPSLPLDEDDHHDRRQQRRRVDSAPATVRLRRQLLGIADSPLRQWDAEVQSIARLLSDNHEDEQLRDTFVNLALQLAAEQPLKTPFVAAVVLVENTLNPDMVDTVLVRLAQAIDNNLALGDWRQVKLLLKFLACLQSCLEGDGVFPLLEELFSRAADLQTASSDDVRHWLNARPQDHTADLNTDNRHGNSQNHSLDHPLCNGRCSRAVPAKGGRSDGQD